MTILSNLDLLLRVPLFASLTPTQAQVVADAIVKKRYRKRELIVEQGKSSDALYIILTGRAQVLSTDGKGREVIFSLLQQGDYVGEMSLIDDEPHSATVRTETDCDVLRLDREAFWHCLPDASSMTHNIMRVLVQRLRAADRKIESLALMDVHGRIARLLIDFAVDDGQGTLVIRDRISRQDLGKMVGASREMVSRVMKSLEDRGFVQTLEDGSMLIRENVVFAN
jgi:CRP/FNR family cyclic AMP-dependent transcriptional regulator